MRDERLIVLLDAYLEGSLTQEEKQELERMLLESDAARREFWQRASLHGWTYAAAKVNYSAKPASEVARERRELRSTTFEAFVEWLQRASQVAWKVVLAGAATSAAVLMWLGIRALQPAPSDEAVVEVPQAVANTNYVATLTRGTSVVWDGEANYVDIGSTLSSRWLRLKSGAVQIEFYDGARVILEGPAALELISSGEARLDYGKLSARVPEPAHGFKVYTADATVTDLGTEFGLNRQPNQPVKVEVFEGKVEVEPRDAQSEVLNAGHGVRVSGRQMLPTAGVDHQEFLSAEELARRESVELSSRYQHWRQADRFLDVDSSILVHLNFEDQRNIDRNLVNRAVGTRAGANALVFGCDWGEGRWPGKQALEFNSVEDRVRLPVPGEFQSLTYITWLRVDSLPNAWNALALVDTQKSGETHWQIHQDGSLELSVRVDNSKGGWDHLISTPVLTPEHFGKWLQLAAVYDGQARKMSLYFNGQLVASKSVRKPRMLTLGTMELGNWTPAASKSESNYRIRNFHGRMDEFALLSRPMSAEEIRRQYEIGRPRETAVVASLKSAIP